MTNISVDFVGNALLWGATIGSFLGAFLSFLHKHELARRLIFLISVVLLTASAYLVIQFLNDNFSFLLQLQTAFFFISAHDFYLRFYAISSCVFSHLFSFSVSVFIFNSFSISSFDFYLPRLILWCVLIFVKKCTEQCESIYFGALTIDQCFQIMTYIRFWP